MSVLSHNWLQSHRLLARISTVFITLLCTKGLMAQDYPGLDQLQQYDRTVSALQTGDFSSLPELLGENAIDEPFALARLLLDNQKPSLALELLEGRENTLDSVDPRYSEIFRLRAEAWSQLGDPQKVRINQLSVLESMRDRLGSRHPVFIAAVDDFVEQWQNDNSINATELAELATWLRFGDQEDDEEFVKKGDLSLESASASIEEGPVVVPVWYGTNRKRGKSDDPSAFYGTSLAKLEVGRLAVTIPPNHKRSVLEKPAFWELSRRPDPLKHIVLAEITPLSIQDFSQQCCDEADKLLFIHGFNVSFHDGALRAAQMAYDLEFPGSAHYFSWPSQGSLFGYLSDANNVVASRPAIIDYLELVTRTPGDLHIVAHSMGNRYLLEALEIFLRDYPDRRLGKIIFAAPDVDQLEFAVRLQSLYGRVDGMILYSSDNDQALRISRTVNGRARAGDSGELLLRLDGMTTIDATGIAADTLGHSYFGDADLVLADIFGFIRLDWSPEERCSLNAGDDASWKINKKGCRVGTLSTANRLLDDYQQNAAAEAKRRNTEDADSEDQFWSEVLYLLEQIQARN